MLAAAVLAVMVAQAETPAQAVWGVSRAMVVPAEPADKAVRLVTVVPVSFCRVARTVLPIRGQSLVALV